MVSLKSVPDNNIIAAPEGDDPLEDEDPIEEENDEEEPSSSSFDSEEDFSDASSYDSDIDDEAARLMVALQGGPTAIPVARQLPQKTREELLDEYVASLHTGKSTAIKMTDSLVSWILDMPVDHQQEKATIVANLFQRLLAAIRVCKEIKHIVLGEIFLQILNPTQSERLIHAILEPRFASTITYWKLGSDDSTKPSGIPTSALLRLMSTTSLVALTEVEIRGLALDTVQHIQQCVEIVQGTPTLKQFNLLGMVLSQDLVTIPGLLDGFVKATGSVMDLDEVQLTRNVAGDTSNSAPLPCLVSPAALQDLLQVKPKWWRLALDGMGLRDEHLQIIASALQGSAACKMNDLLSIQDNPSLTPRGLKQLYTVCVNKQRMGLVLSDDPTWVATFDLVRPLNNLHRRLEYKDPASGRYLSKEGWIDWLVVLNNLPWLDDNRKLSYVWFTLLDQPDMVVSR